VGGLYDIGNDVGRIVAMNAGTSSDSRGLNADFAASPTSSLHHETTKYRFISNPLRIQYDDINLLINARIDL
jgi:hypothetical protein